MHSAEYVGCQTHQEDDAARIESILQRMSCAFGVLNWSTSVLVSPLTNLTDMSVDPHQQCQYETPEEPNLWQLVSFDRPSYAIQLSVIQGVLPMRSIRIPFVDQILVEKARDRQQKCAVVPNIDLRRPPLRKVSVPMSRRLIS